MLLGFCCLVCGKIRSCLELWWKISKLKKKKTMALGKRCGSTASEGLGFGVVRYTRSMSGKRVGFSSNMEVDSTITPPPLKRQCSLEMMIPSSEKSLLEALPQDILVSTIKKLITNLGLEM